MGLNSTNITEVFEPLSGKVSDRLMKCKVERDELNSHVRSHLDKRNEINRQVKELITEVQNQKSIRNEANSKVRDLKKIRLERSNELKSLRGKLRDISSSNGAGKRGGPSSEKIKKSINNLDWKHQTGQIKPNKEKEFFTKMKRLQKDLRDAVSKEEASSSHVLRKVRAAESVQAEAHKLVEDAVVSAQDAHDLMIELSEEVDRLRELANQEHLGLTKTKFQADILHNQYIVSLRCIHSMQDITKMVNSKEKMHEEDGGRVEVSDLMSRLMSGDTLSTDELMLLQRN